MPNVKLSGTLIMLLTFRPSAVQSETCHPWSRSEKVHAPLEICRKYFKWSGGSTLTCDNFKNSCAFFKTGPISLLIFPASRACTARLQSHAWLPKLYTYIYDIINIYMYIYIYMYIKRSNTFSNDIFKTIHDKNTSWVYIY